MSGILFVIGMAFVVGFLLIFATSMSGKKRFDGIGKIADDQPLVYDRFIRVCKTLVESLKLEIDNIELSQDEQTIDIYAHSATPITGSSFLIHGALKTPQEPVSAAELVELSSAIIQDRLSKGIFITNSTFTEELPSISELAPMEFIDGKKLEELAKKYKIPLTT